MIVVIGVAQVTSITTHCTRGLHAGIIASITTHRTRGLHAGIVVHRACDVDSCAGGEGKIALSQVKGCCACCCCKWKGNLVLIGFRSD